MSIKRVFNINGVKRTLICNGDEKLSTILRDRLLLTGCKIGCGVGQCGACTVLVDGKVQRACILPISRIPDYAEITTVEGIGTVDNLHPVQVAWMAHGCAQCGFCTPGFIVSAKALLDENPSPTREEVRDWFQKNRNLCRCTGYKPLVDATMDAAAVLRGEKSKEDLLFTPNDNIIVGTSFARPSAAMSHRHLGLRARPLYAARNSEGSPLFSRVSHANIKGVDTSEAEKITASSRLSQLDMPGKNRINGLVMLPLNNKCDGWDRPIPAMRRSSNSAMPSQ